MKSVQVILYSLLIGIATFSAKATELPQLHQAVLQAQLEHVKNMLNSDGPVACDVNQRDVLGSTALHLAVRADNVDMVKLLLKHHASGNISDGRGQKAMDLAKSWSVWWMLLKSGAMPGIDTLVFIVSISLLVVLGFTVWLRRIKIESAMQNNPFEAIEDQQEKSKQNYRDAA